MTRHLKIQFENTAPAEIHVVQKCAPVYRTPCKWDRVIVKGSNPKNWLILHAADGTNAVSSLYIVRELRGAKSIRVFMADGTSVRMKFGKRQPRFHAIDVARGVY